MAVLSPEFRDAVKDALRSPAWRRRPDMINVELTAACDARCIHCPRLEMDRPMGIMSGELFRRLVDDAAALRVPTLCPNGYGEICTIPLPILRGFFGDIRSKSHRFRIIVNSNGHRMSADHAALFLEHEVHLLNVTIDGATAGTAESIRQGLRFHEIEANVKRLLQMRRQRGSRFPKVRVGMVAMPHTLAEWPAFSERWRGIADFVGVGGFSSRLSSVAVADPTSPGSRFTTQTDPPDRCVLPFRDLNIWADGKAVLCCEDWNEELVIGDLRTQSLSEIWRSEAVSAVRRRHVARRGREVALCAKCDHWIRPTAGARLWS